MSKEHEVDVRLRAINDWVSHGLSRDCTQREALEAVRMLADAGTGILDSRGVE